MRQLTLLRHAKSSRKDADLPDFDRPLNRRGREDAPRMGRWLRQQEAAPDLVLASPAVRARLTAEAAVESLGLDADRLRFRDEIYEADLGALMELVRGLDDACGHVLLVGHNPGFTDLWNHLSAEKTDNIPTCGAFSLRLPAASWQEVAAGSGRPAFTAIPREIGGVPGKEVPMGKKDKEKKKGGCLHGKSEAKVKPGNFECDKCGAVSDEKKHLCRPEKIKKK